MQTILFDLDGTLIHLDVPIEVVRSQLRQFFIDRGDDRAMRPILASIRAAAKACTANADEAEQLRSKALELLDDAEVIAAQLAAVDPLVIRTILALKKRGHRLGLLTNNSSRCARAALDRLVLGSAFELVVSRDDVREPKPSAEGIGLAWERLGRPSALCMVGDSTADVACARTFGQTTAEVVLEIVGVTGGRNSAAELSTAGADRVLDSVVGLVSE